MSEAELGRHEGDRAVIPRVIGQPLAFGKGMLGFGYLRGIAIQWGQLRKAASLQDDDLIQ